jgi:molecular chaperone DnaK
MQNADKKAKEEAIEKLNASRWINISNLKNRLKDYGDKIPAEKKATIESALTGLKTAHAAKDLAGIDSATTSLNAAWEAASQEMYAAMNEQQGGAANPGTGAEGAANADAGSKGENVTDVDYEEVK